MMTQIADGNLAAAERTRPQLGGKKSARGSPEQSVREMVAAFLAAFKEGNLDETRRCAKKLKTMGVSPAHAAPRSSDKRQATPNFSA